jgi:TatD DNase family protein
VFEILDARADGVPVVLHCFLAPWRVQDAIDRGWFCSFSGIVTYPGSDDLREAAAALPEELLLVETDAPYLAPQPVRGKPNEPAHVVDTARAVAEVRGEAYEDLERVVEANARRLFGW